MDYVDCPTTHVLFPAVVELFYSLKCIVIVVYTVPVCGDTVFGFALILLSKFCQPLKIKF